MQRLTILKHSTPAKNSNSRSLNFHYGEDDRWVGLPLEAGKSLPGGKLSIAVQSAEKFDVRQPLAGVLIDEWVEVVPSTTETTGIALQYDQPNAAPPQTILIAVPPRDRITLDHLVLAAGAAGNIGSGPNPRS